MVRRPRPRRLSWLEKRELRRLEQMGDEDIDTSDIPEVSDDFWKRAERGRFYRPK